MKINYSIIIDFFSMIISGFTLLMTYKISSRANNISKNSVRPYLDIIIGNYSNCTYIKIKNNGLGTAIIKNIIFTYENKNLINQPICASNIIDAIIKYNKHITSENKIDNEYVTFVEDIKNRGIGAHDEIIILEKRYEKINNSLRIEDIRNNMSPERKKLLTFLKDLKIKVEYINIFGDEIKPPCERKLHFFGKNLLNK